MLFSEQNWNPHELVACDNITVGFRPPLSRAACVCKLQSRAPTHCDDDDAALCWAVLT